MAPYDFTDEQQEVLNKAVEIGVISAVEIGCKMAEYGPDFAHLEHDLLQTAWAHFHTDREMHTKYCKVRDKYYIAMALAA